MNPSIEVAEEMMNQERVEVFCPHCAATISITTKAGVKRRQTNPVSCEGCGSVVVIQDPQGNDLNLWWTAAASEFEASILELFNSSRFDSRVTAEAFRKLVREAGEETVRDAADRLMAQTQGRAIGTWMVGDLIGMVRKRTSYIDVTKTPAEAPTIRLHLHRFEEPGKDENYQRTHELYDDAR